ncbi:hypothetical protein [Enterobacter sp.]|nr:hypothetical protein [Enterobacter sp.]
MEKGCRVAPPVMPDRLPPDDDRVTGKDGIGAVTADAVPSL